MEAQRGPLLLGELPAPKDWTATTTNALNSALNDFMRASLADSTGRRRLAVASFRGTIDGMNYEIWLARIPVHPSGEVQVRCYIEQSPREIGVGEQYEISVKLDPITKPEKHEIIGQTRDRAFAEAIFSDIIHDTEERGNANKLLWVYREYPEIYTRIQNRINWDRTLSNWNFCEFIVYRP
jgi:hypothetical protein